MVGLGALDRGIVSNWKLALYLHPLLVQKLGCLIGLFRVGISSLRLSRRLTPEFG